MSLLRLTSFSLLVALASAAPARAQLFATPMPQSPAAQPVAPAPAAAPAFTYHRDDLLGDLTQQLAAHYRATGDLQLELLRAWNAPTAAEPITALVVEAPSTLSSTLLVRIRLTAGSQTLSESTVLLRAALMRDVWFSRTPIQRDTTFDPAQLDTRRVDTLRERDAISVDETTGDLSFARSVPASRMVSWRDVIRRALVRKGDVIEVAAVDGPLAITMKALAMENGSAGETVRVRNLESRKEFSALVVAESRAQVRF